MAENREMPTEVNEHDDLFLINDTSVDDLSLPYDIKEA